jgi:hypothetical protein
MFLFMSRVWVMMSVIRSRSLGCFPSLFPLRVCRVTRCIAALLSTIQRSLHRCFFPQSRASAAISVKADAYPQSSLRVEEEVSRGPSTGPEHWKRVSLLVASIHPNVPNLSLRPPSDAMFILCRDWNAFHIVASVATWLRCARSRRSVLESLFMVSLRESCGCGWLWSVGAFGSGYR